MQLLGLTEQSVHDASKTANATSDQTNNSLTKPSTGGTNTAAAATEQSINGVSKAANAASDQTNNILLNRQRVAPM